MSGLKGLKSLNYTDSYAYAVGRTKALEARMLDPARIQRITEAPDYEEAVRYLADSEYSHMAGDTGFERALEEERRRVHLTVASYSPDPYFTGLFFAAEDFLCLKSVIKELFLKGKAAGAGARKEKRGGWLGPDEVFSVAEAAYEDAPRDEEEMKLDFASALKKLTGAGYVEYVLRDAAYRAAASFRASEDSLDIDITVDKAYFKYAVDIASSRKASWLSGFIALKVDLVNVVMLMRAMNTGKGLAFLEKSMVEGGNIALKDLLEAHREGASRLQKLLEATNYWKVLSSGFEAWSRTSALRPFEMAAEGLLASYARQSKQMSSGYEPVVGYLIAKDTEIATLRKVLTGKSKRLAVPFIRERLSDGNA